MIEHRAQEDLDPVIHAPARLVTMARRSRRRALVLALIGASVLAWWPALAEPNRYFAAPFTVRTNPVTFGQAPSWTHDGRVLWTKPDGSGVEQVYVSELDGSRVTCLTCALPGPNRYPLEQPPKGDWILFCSWRGQTFLGAPCFGGYGTNLYVMRADGTQVTRLTNVDGGPDPQDNYHPAWSPDGKRLVWTHLDFRLATQGGTQYRIMLADFVDDASGPHLANVRALGPGWDAGIETQVWAPDGSGVLFTLWGGKALSGWMNGELYFMRLFGAGASPARPVVSQLTDGNPAWDEQAVFTPDMKNVIWMSSRDYPTWYQTVVSAAQWLGFDAPQASTVFGPVFFETIGDPRFKTDLYMMALKSRAVRRLTFDGSIVPEFHFDRKGKRLLWTETGAQLGGGPVGPTRIGTFHLHPGAGRRAATVPAAAGIDIGSWNAAQVAPREPTLHAAPAPAVPPQVIAGLPLAIAALNQIAHRLQGLAGGGSCCAGSPSGAFLDGPGR